MNKILSIVPAQGVATCDRCFKQISWIATVQTSESVLRVGIDCAETMQAQNLATAKKNIATAKKVQGWAKGAKSIKVLHNAYLKSVGKPMDTVVIETAKGLRRNVSINFLKKYCPNIAI